MRRQVAEDWPGVATNGVWGQPKQVRREAAEDGSPEGGRAASDTSRQGLWRVDIYDLQPVGERRGEVMVCAGGCIPTAATAVDECRSTGGGCEGVVDVVDHGTGSSQNIRLAARGRRGFPQVGEVRAS
jgi:hypothetical protein